MVRPPSLHLPNPLSLLRRRRVQHPSHQQEHPTVVVPHEEQERVVDLKELLPERRPRGGRRGSGSRRRRRRGRRPKTVLGHGNYRSRKYTRASTYSVSVKFDGKLCSFSYLCAMEDRWRLMSGAMSWRSEASELKMSLTPIPLRDEATSASEERRKRGRRTFTISSCNSTNIRSDH